MNIKSIVRTIPDFPRPGISFKDITPVLSNAEALRTVVNRIADEFRGKADTVVGIESRGFIVGAPVAYAMGVGLSIVRKPGKLPYRTVSEVYELEYGSDSLEIHNDAFSRGTRVLLVDDLLATGGTAQATLKLVGSLGAEAVACAFIIELDYLGGAKRLAPVPTYSLVHYKD
ncbi:MAG: adenine phosphoribosyltransferase [Candidatus Binatia bacterium]